MGRRSASMARRSSSSRGALRKFAPTTKTGTPAQPRAWPLARRGPGVGLPVPGRDLADEVDGGPALLVEGEDLQLGGEVDLAERDPGRHLEVGRGEVQDRGDAGRDQPVADLLGGGGRGGDDADRHLLLLHHAVQVVDVVDGQLAELLADLAAVGVQQGGDAEARARRSPGSLPGRGRDCRPRRSPPPSPAPARARGGPGRSGTRRRSRRPWSRRSRGRTGPCGPWPSSPRPRRPAGRRRRGGSPAPTCRPGSGGRRAGGRRSPPEYGLARTPTPVTDSTRV